MKAAIFDPYLDTLGGGERYCLTVAEILLSQNYQVDLFWSGAADLIQKACHRFELDLTNLNVVKTPNNLIDKYQTTKNYDLIFYLGDGSVPFLFSQKNLLHVQVPFTNHFSLKDQILNQIKLKKINQIICNSRFTQNFTQAHLHTQKTIVLYPPVDVEKFSPHPQKKNWILSVGRFDNLLNTKRQDVLIDAFKMLNPTDWKLILMGGSLNQEHQNTFLKNLKNQAHGLSVEFIVNPDFKKLQQIYSQSKIYWHAAGFGVDHHLHPEKTEHFGITVVEAMASGLVPLVVNQGGLPEIVTDGKNGYLWQTQEQLSAKTRLLIQDQKLYHHLQAQALLDCQKFSKSAFAKQFLNIIKKT